MARIAEHERASLTTDVPEKGLVAGDVGTVVSVHHSEDGERPAGYTLGFFSPESEKIALATVRAARPPAGATDVT